MKKFYNDYYTKNELRKEQIVRFIEYIINNKELDNSTLYSNMVKAEKNYLLNESNRLIDEGEKYNNANLVKEAQVLLALAKTMDTSTKANNKVVTDTKEFLKTYTPPKENITIITEENNQQPATTKAPSSNPNKDNSLAIGLGVFFGILFLILIIVLIVLAVKYNKSKKGSFGRRKYR